MTVARRALRRVRRRLGAVRSTQAQRLEARRAGVGPPQVSADSRVVIGPANSAGQGYRWSRAIDHHVAGAAATNYTMVTDRTYPFPTDWAIAAEVYNGNRAWSERQAAYLARHFTHGLWESGRHPLGTAVGTTPWEQMAHLAKHGVRPAFMAHGSDVRTPSHHADMHPWSPFRDRDHPLTVALERKTYRLHEELASFAGPRFVSTPDLLDYVPDAMWVPVIADPRWATVRPVEAPHGRLRVGHVTSNSMIKRSDEIEAALEPLVTGGIIDFTRLVGIAPADMPGAVAACDVVVDQFGVGSYGVAACEAMLAGRVVIGNVTRSVRSTVQRDHGRELPLVQSELDSLAAIIDALAKDPAELVRIASLGPAFVSAVHDGRASATALQTMLP